MIRTDAIGSETIFRRDRVLTVNKGQVGTRIHLVFQNYQILWQFVSWYFI